MTIFAYIRSITLTLPLIIQHSQVYLFHKYCVLRQLVFQIVSAANAAAMYYYVVHLEKQ